MTTRGVEGVYVETHSWGKTAKFLESLGFKVEFATEHGSGMLKNDDGPYFVVGEIPEDRKPQTQLILRVEDAETFKPDPIVEVVSRSRRPITALSGWWCATRTGANGASRRRSRAERSVARRGWPATARSWWYPPTCGVLPSRRTPPIPFEVGGVPFFRPVNRGETVMASVNALRTWPTGAAPLNRAHSWRKAFEQGGELLERLERRQTAR